MENDNFGLPQRHGAHQTAVSPRCEFSLTRLVHHPFESALVSRTGSWSTTFLLTLLGIGLVLGLSGCGAAPGSTSKAEAAGSLSVSASSLSFGSVAVGNMAAESVVLTNPGSASVLVSQVQVAGMPFSVAGSPAMPLTIAAGASYILTVDFKPTAAGNASGTLSVTADSATDTITLSGIGAIAAAVPGLTVSSTSVAFGTVATNTSVSQSVLLTSSGTAPLTISGATLTGSGFTMSNLGLPLTLSPGQTASLTVTFDPANASSFTGAVTLNTNASKGAVTIQLSGSGHPIQSLLNDFTCARDNVVGQGSENCTITLTSRVDTGGVTVGLMSSDPSVVAVPSTMTIAAGTSSGIFSLKYYPVTEARTVTLSANSNNNGHKQHNINVGGSTPGLKISSGLVSFGNVMVNATSKKTVTLTSSGTASLTISSATVAGSGYSVSGMGLPVTLNPGQSANLTVSFDPTAAGPSNGSIALATNISTSTPAIDLSGTGQVPGALSGITCASSSVTGAANDACTVSLSSAAGSSGLTVALGSSNSAVAVPASVLFPAGATSAGFTAAISSVTTAQTATLTAQAGGVTQTFAIGLGGAAPGLSLATTSLSFGNVTLNTPTTQSVLLTSSGSAPLTISAASATGSGFTISSPSFPVTLNQGQTATLVVQFDPTTAGAATGAVTLATNTSAGSAAIALSGTGATSAALNALTCSSSSITGAASDSCTVSLTAAAGAGGMSITLSSSSTSLAAPASVLVPAGASSAGFSATASAVTTAQTATLTAQAGGVTKTYAISMSAGTPGLTLGSATLSFGNVNLNSPATQSVLLTSSGTAPLTISSDNVTGSGFSISGLSFPLTLNPGATATLNVQFDPTTAGSAAGAATVTTNASPATASIALNGTGQATSYQVDLSWDPPGSSTDPAVGYNVYRAVSGSSSYQLLNSAAVGTTSYSDTTVAGGTSYVYYVKSVDSAGNLSGASNSFSIAIP